MSTGYGVGIDFSTMVDWVPIKTSWLITGKFKANAVVIDNKGVVEIDIDESV